MDIVKKIFSPLALLVISLGVYFFFGFSHLTHFHTADEHYWISDPNCGRIYQYWNAVAQQNWPKTFINDKPGITLAYVAVPALFFNKDVPSVFEKNAYCSVGSVEKVLHLAFRFRMPILLFNGFFCFYFFWILGRILKNSWVASWASSLILLSPILLGASQIVNPDSLLWVFATASILTFFAYLQTQERRMALLTALFTGLAILTKYTAIILYPYFLIAMLIFFSFNVVALEGKMNAIAKKIFLGYCAILGISLGLFALLMPAVFFVQRNEKGGGFMDLKGISILLFAILFVLVVVFADSYVLRSKLLKKISRFFFVYKEYIVKIIFAAFIFLVGIVLFFWMRSYSGFTPDFMKVPFDNGKGVEFYQQPRYLQSVLELAPLVFSIQPLVLFALVFLLLKAIWKKIEHAELVFSLMFFVGLFYAAVLSQRLLVDIRYSIILYPIVMVLATLGLYEFAKSVLMRLTHKNIIISAVIVVACITSLWLSKPFYFNYNNILLPKDRVIADAWGYGGYESAQYLNSLPNAKNLVVWSDYNGFCEFFSGTCVKGNRFLKKWNRKENAEKIDYFVKTRRGSILYDNIWRRMENNGDYLEESPLWSLNINERSGNYIRIYKNNNNSEN